MLKSKTLLTKSLLYTCIALVLLAGLYFLIQTSDSEKANMGAYYGFGMLCLSQFILHFFHRKKGKKSDDQDLEADTEERVALDPRVAPV